MRQTPLLAGLFAGLFVLGGCGPLAIGAGLNEAFKEKNQDLTDPIVEILSEGGNAPRPSFKAGEPVRFLLRTNKRNVELRSWLEVEPLLALPDVNGCPRDFRGDLIERFGSDAGTVDPVSLSLAFDLSDAELEAAGIPTSAPFAKEVRLWVRGTDPEDRVLCVSHVFRIDRDPPAAPGGVAVVARDPHELEVRWEPPPESDLAGYLVVWDVPVDGTAPIGTVPYDAAQRVRGSRFNLMVDPGAPTPDPTQDASGLHVAGGSTTEAVIRGLYALRPHFVAVRAVDEAGNLSPLDNGQERYQRTRGGGDGRFVVAGSTGGFHEPAAIADFDGDRLPDIATAGRDIEGVLVRFALTRISGRQVTFETHEVSVPPSIGPIGSARRHLAAGDFDHDGRADLALAVSSRLVTIRGGPPGPGGAPTLSGVSAPEFSSFEFLALHSADLDRDGHADLVPLIRSPVCDGGPCGGLIQTDAAALLRGVGDVTFAFPQDPVTTGDVIGQGTGESVLADFDGDSISDVAAVQAASVAVVLFERDGSYRAVRRFSTNGVPRSLAAGDFTGDGKPDLAARNTDGRIAVLEGDGTGRFTPRSHFLPNDGAAGPLAAGDFDADGILDLAAGGPGRVTILLGSGAEAKGDGGFTAGESVALGFSPERILVHDLDGDGILDLVADETVLLGRGAAGRGLSGFAPGAPTLETGRFLDPEQGFGGFDGWIVVEIVDLDRDGIPDLVASRGRFGTIVVYRGLGVDAQGAAQFGDPTTYFADASLGLERIAAGTITRDRFPDLAATGALFPGSADGTLGEPSATATGAGPLRAVDLDLDGLFDLATGDHTILFSNGDGTFAPLTKSHSGPYVVSGDFNGDGMPDLFAGQSMLFGSRGAGGFPAREFTAGPIGDVVGIEAATTDFDGDGRSDLAAATDDRVSIHLADPGEPTGFRLAQELMDWGGNHVVIADFNGDRFGDVLASSMVRMAERDSAGRPTGKMETAFVPAPLGHYLADKTRPANDLVRVADLNSDGVPDLVEAAVGNSTPDKIIVYLGMGTILDR